MGAKSNNLKVLKEKTPDWMHVPESICLPFKLMEHFLAACDPQGSARIGRLINRLTKTKKAVKMAGRLLRCKQIVLNL
jgi:alpha-glucan,water dikinase